MARNGECVGDRCKFSSWSDGVAGLAFRGMKAIIGLCLALALSAGLVAANEDPNLSKFEKAFPEASPIKVPDGVIFRRYSLPAKLSISDITKRLGQAFGRKFELLPTDGLVLGKTGADYKNFAVAKLLVSGEEHFGMITKEKESDAFYTVGIIMEIEVKQDPGVSKAPGGRETNIDMRLPRKE